MFTLALALRLPSLPTLGGSGSPPPPPPTNYLTTATGDILTTATGDRITWSA